MEACYGGTDVMERSCAVARGIDINIVLKHTVRARSSSIVALAIVHTTDNSALLYSYSVPRRGPPVLSLSVLLWLAVLV
jgi:hypothetical protein